MDTSKEYIEMCQRAEEIQDKHEWVFGDYFSEWISSPYEWDDGDERKNFKPHYTKGRLFRFPSQKDDTNVWLPRQDQLQEMVPGYIEQSRFVAPLADKFADFAVDCANDPRHWMFSTFEQLWLSFVMIKKYRKAWDSAKKEWIKG